jgi:serine/threonine protein kinase
MPSNPIETAVNGSIRGRTLAHFELLEPIGVGGMAAVLRARDKQLDRFVALKILPPEMAADPENIKRFHQEARAAAKLDHENIARVYFCGEDQRLHFIAFEFVEGQNLRTLLERRGRLPVREAVHYLLQIATGLAHAASRGVVHRDIKPSNIIITPSGRAKLVDMGLARSLAPHDNRQLTQSGVTLGTFDYISPEQALEPRDADVRSDIYSLGCTFYHMLTGQPPVPEGTAAKKLHHHQHVAPPDPRQINPDIPDEVAIVLQRMMAKDPKDRYQKAEHLVQHLIQIAQKLGGAEATEGLLFVDAPILNPPRKRPLLLASIATVVLGAFVLAVALTPAPPALQPLSLPKNLAPQNPDLGQAKTAAPDLERMLPETRQISTTEQLRRALAEDHSMRLVLLDDLRVYQTGLVYRGGPNREIFIESPKGERQRTLEFVNEPDGDAMSLVWAGFTVEDGTLTCNNVQFSIIGGVPGQQVIGVLVKAGHVTFKRCTFKQPTRPDDLHFTSLAAWNLGLRSQEQAPQVKVRECFFPAGEVAIAVKGNARLDQVDCAFGPHANLFQVGAQAKGDHADLVLRNVSAHTISGPVLRLEENADCHLNVDYSIFAGPQSSEGLDRPEFIHQNGDVGIVIYKGHRNAYRGISPYWVKPGGEGLLEAGWATFKDWIDKSEGSDEASTELSISPWKNTTASAINDPKNAFQINDKLSQLRRQDTEKKNLPIGVEDCTWGRVNPVGLKVPESAKADELVAKLKANERLVDPTAVGGERVYKKVESAVSEAQPGDVILIKHNGLLAVEPTTLSEGRRVTLRPFDNHYHPILVLGKSTKDPAALFHLHYSTIAFDHIEFLLRPDVANRSLSVVSVGGNSTCNFEHCVVTLDAGIDTSAARLDVVAMLDPKDMMKTSSEATRPRTEVAFEGCFVRGAGNLVGVRASRLFDLRIDTSLVCMAGSLLAIQPDTTETAVGESRVSVDINRTTAYFSEQPAFVLNSGKMGRGLAPMQINAVGCLFGTASSKPLVRLDGPENDSQLKKVLSWAGERNWLCGFDKILEQSSDTGSMLVYQSEEWKRFTSADAMTRIDRLPMQLAGSADKAMAMLVPKDFQFENDAPLFGVPTESVPVPSPEVNGLQRGDD